MPAAITAYVTYRHRILFPAEGRAQSLPGKAHILRRHLRSGRLNKAALGGFSGGAADFRASNEISIGTDRFFYPCSLRDRACGEIKDCGARLYFGCLLYIYYGCRIKAARLRPLLKSGEQVALRMRAAGLGEGRPE